MIWDLAKGALILVFCIGLGTAVIVWGAQWLWTRRSSYDPRFADTPDLDAAFADARRIVTGRLPLDEVEQLVRSHDWHAAEYMVRRSGAPKEQT
jgi:hypothetical protein